MASYEIDQIELEIYDTLQHTSLKQETVIAACDILSKRIRDGYYLEMMQQMGVADMITGEELETVSQMLRKETLLAKVKTELGADLKRSYPLGVLFHIGAGNADGVAAYSIIEGLLAGNINLVKLSSSDSGISAFLLEELIRIEPLLKRYIYLFAVSSNESDRIKAIAALADGIVVWGSDKTVQAIRTIAAPNQRMIEWGHRISFSYITKAGASKEKLHDLAEHIIKTRQLLCSSCQGIYIESDDSQEINHFCREFVKILETKAVRQSADEIGLIAQNTLRSYTHMLEAKIDQSQVFKGVGVNLFYKENRELELSMQGGNLWVKSLPRNEIIHTLKKYHGYLQTVGLLCSGEERKELAEIFVKAGANKIRSAGDMSTIYPGESHDGEAPLRRYTRLVDA